MVNRLETTRRPETIEKIKEALKKRYMSNPVKDETRRKISEKMKMNWKLKKLEELNNELKSGENE